MSVLSRLAEIITPEALADAGVPSASIAILDPDRSISTTMLTLGSETPSTLYQACSVSKALTALLLAKLVDQSLLSYSDPVTSHLPASIAPLVTEPTTRHFLDHVTLSHLISHRSGLSQHGFPGYASTPLPTAAEVLAGRAPSRTPRIRFQSFPGAHAPYAGGNFVLLQLHLETRFGLPFAALMAREVLRPLGLTRSRYGDPHADGSGGGEGGYARAHWTTGTDEGSARGYWMFGAEDAAAGLWTTAEELVVVADAVQGSLRGRSGAFLSREVAELMLEKLEPEGTLGMRRGWGAGDGWFGHSGDNWPGYASYVLGGMGGQGREIGIAVLCNSMCGPEATRKIVAAVMYLMGVQVSEKLPCGFPEWNRFVPYAAVGGGDELAEDWSSWVGSWEKQWSLSTDDKGSLRISHGASGLEARLLPAACPPVVKDGYRERIFVVEGLETAVRLVEHHGEKHLEITQEEVMGDILTLKRDKK